MANAPPPEIERPIVAEPSETRVPEEPKAAARGSSTIGLMLQASSLSRSMMNITLHYRLTITNRTLAMIDSLTVSGDLVSARPGIPIPQQVANAGTELPGLHEIARLSGKQTKDFTGKITLPVSALVPARRGTPMYVPLLRLRVDGHQDGPKSQTFVIGMLPNVAGGKLQPFRLDEQPQTYSQIGERPID